MPSMRKPRVAVELSVSLHCMYLGLRTPCCALSCSVGAPGSIHCNHLLIHVFPQTWTLSGFCQLLFQIRSEKRKNNITESQKNTPKSEDFHLSKPCSTLRKCPLCNTCQIYLLPILQSIIEGESKSARRSSIRL